MPWGKTEADYRSVVTDVTIADGITILEGRILAGLKNATGTLAIPDSVTYIGTNLFHSCGFSKIVLSNNITGVGSQIGLYLCPNLKTIEFSDGSICNGTIYLDNEGVGDSKVTKALYYIEDDNAYFWQIPGGVGKDYTEFEIKGSINHGVDTYNVVGIGRVDYTADSYTFSSAKSLTSLVIPPSLKQISKQSFNGATNLSTITIKGKVVETGKMDFSSITDMGSGVLTGCKNAESLVLNDNIDSIGASTFKGCTNLREIHLPSNLTFIGREAFASSGLTSVYIPDSVTTIEYGAFMNCTELTKITGGSGLTGVLGVNQNGSDQVGDLITGCTSLKRIELEGSAGLVITSKSLTISQVALQNRSSIPLEYFSLQNGTINLNSFKNKVSDVGGSIDQFSTDLTLVLGSGATLQTSSTAGWESPFADLDCIKSIDVNMSDVPEKAFYGSDNIAEIHLGENVKTIGNMAFSKISQLTSVNIPASITHLGDHIFAGDTFLSTVTWDAGFEAPTVVDTDSNHDEYEGKYVPTSMFDGCISLGSGLNLNEWLPTSFTGVGCASFRGTQFGADFSKWTGLKYIGTRAFEKMANITSADLNKDIEYGFRNVTGGYTNSAFIGSGLTSITFNCMYIPNGIVSECIQLKDVTLNNTVTIPKNTFYRLTQLETITIPSTVTYIGEYAFEGCSGLQNIIFESENLVFDENVSVFGGCTSLTTMTIGKNAYVDFQNNVFRASGEEPNYFENAYNWYCTYDHLIFSL